MLKSQPTYPALLEVAKEIPGATIRAFWHHELGRLYLYHDVMQAFNYEDKRANSPVRFMKGNLQCPPTGISDRERVNVKVKLSDYESAKSHIWLTALGFVVLLEESPSTLVNLVRLREAIESKVGWAKFRATMINHGWSKLCVESKLRLEHELEFQRQLPEMTKNLLQLPQAN